MNTYKEMLRDFGRSIGALNNRPYSGNLPKELALWHLYVPDSGHSILVVLSSLFDGDFANIRDWMVPAPPKAVLRKGYEIREGYIFCDLPYDEVLGLVTDEKDEEF